MAQSSNVYQWLWRGFCINALVVLVLTYMGLIGTTHATLGEVGPDVQFSSDPPSLPVTGDDPPKPITEPAVGQSPANAPSQLPGERFTHLPSEANGPVAGLPPHADLAPGEQRSASGRVGDNFVLEEILKAVRSNPDLQVMPLEFPQLPIAGRDRTEDGAVGGEGPGDRTRLPALSRRLKSLMMLSQAAQQLVEEARLLESIGRRTEAAHVLAEVAGLRTVMARLAAPSLHDGSRSRSTSPAQPSELDAQLPPP